MRTAIIQTDSLVPNNYHKASFMNSYFLWWQASGYKEGCSNFLSSMKTSFEPMSPLQNEIHLTGVKIMLTWKDFIASCWLCSSTMHYILSVTLVQNLSQLFAILYSDTHSLFRMKLHSENPNRTISSECHCEAYVPEFIMKICRIIAYAFYFSHQRCLKAVTKVNLCKHPRHCLVLGILLRILKYVQRSSSAICL